MAKSNKEIALEALKRAFIERDPTVVQLFASNYKQHNPVIPDGPSAIAKLIPTLTALKYEPGMAVAGIKDQSEIASLWAYLSHFDVDGSSK